MRSADLACKIARVAAAISMDNKYLPTTEQFDKDKKMRKEWRFLRKRELVSCVWILGWLIPPIVFLFIAMSYGWGDRDSPDHARKPVWPALMLFVPSILCFCKALRNPTALKYAGRCFACGNSRSEFADACRRCGAQFALQDLHILAMQHAASRFRHLTRVDHVYLTHALGGLLIIIVPFWLLSEFYHPIDESVRDDARKLLVATGVMVGVLLGGVGVITLCGLFLMRSLDKKLDWIADSCLACGVALPEKHAEHAWCGSCGVSLLWQRREREHCLKKRAERKRRTS